LAVNGKAVPCDVDAVVAFLAVVKSRNVYGVFEIFFVAVIYSLLTFER